MKATGSCANVFSLTVETDSWQIFWDPGQRIIRSRFIDQRPREHTRDLEFLATQVNVNGNLLTANRKGRYGLDPPRYREICQPPVMLVNRKNHRYLQL